MPGRSPSPEEWARTELAAPSVPVCSFKALGLGPGSRKQVSPPRIRPPAVAAAGAHKKFFSQTSKDHAREKFLARSQKDSAKDHAKDKFLSRLSIIDRVKCNVDTDLSQLHLQL